MTPPTVQEIDEAADLYLEEGPEAVARVIDGHKGLTETIAGIAEMTKGADIPDKGLVKCGVVLGLNLGIRIGEARAAKLSTRATKH